MSNNTAVVNYWLSKRDTLLTERGMAIERFDAEITEVEDAIKTLTGKTISEMVTEVLYDDQHPDYIKASAEEI